MRHEGRKTKEKCPECGEVILYNGNYFCANFSEGCDWALPHPQALYRDQLISYRLCGSYEDGNDGTDLGRIVHEKPKQREIRVARASEFEFVANTEGTVQIIHSECRRYSSVVVNMKEALDYCRGHQCEDTEMSFFGD